MRHKKAGKRLGRKTSHKKAMMRNMAVSLIKHERIVTTTAKAKELRPAVERLVTRSLEDSPHNFRYVLTELQDEKAVKKLFSEIAPLYKDIKGGYTRIVRLGGSRWIDGAKWAANRLGDNGERAIIEFTQKTVDEKKDIKPKKKKKKA